MITLSQTLKKLRENSGLTQQQVADALNLERSTYTYYETGKTVPDINTIIKLSKIFNVSYIDIFEEEEKQRNTIVCDVDNYSFYNSVDEDKSIYELSKNEKSLITFFRILPPEQQKKFLKNISDIVEGIPRNPLKISL